MGLNQDLKILLKRRDELMCKVNGIDQRLREIYVKKKFYEYGLKGGEIISVNGTQFQIAYFKETCLLNNLNDRFVYLYGRKVEKDSILHKTLVCLHNLPTTYTLIKKAKEI